MDETPRSDAAEIERLRAEQAQLEADMEELRSRLHTEKARKGGRTRGVTAAALVVVTSLVFTVAVGGVWARRNALNTSRWVETVGPIAEDPAVQQAFGRYATDELMTVIDPESFFESVLPERGQVLAVPLTNALRGFVNDKVDEFLASDTFHSLWVEINERVHRRVVQVLEGSGEPPPGIEVRGDDVVINVVPVLNGILARIGEASPEIFGRTVDLPTVSVDDIPEDAIEKIEDATGLQIPSDFGQFTVFDASRLNQVQDAVEVFNRLVVVAAILAVLLVALTLWVSPRRRRTLIQLMVGIALGTVILRRLGIRLEDDVVDIVKPENQDAVRVIVGAFVSSLLDATQWILAIAAVVAIVAVVSGPYPWARSFRSRVAAGARDVGAVVRAAVTGDVDTPAARWLAEHREIVQGAAIVVGILILLWADLSWFGLLVLLALVAAVVVGAQRIADAAGGEGEEEDAAGPGPVSPEPEAPPPAVQPR
jgi:hypothetical protein